MARLEGEKVRLEADLKRLSAEMQETREQLQHSKEDKRRLAKEAAVKESRLAKLESQARRNSDMFITHMYVESAEICF